jgi:hypothetical protein
MVTAVAETAGAVLGAGLISMGAIEATGEASADWAATAPASRREAASAAVAPVQNLVFIL